MNKEEEILKQAKQLSDKIRANNTHAIHTGKDKWTVPDLQIPLAEYDKLIEAISLALKEKEERINELYSRVDEGRDYLMQIEPDELTVGDTLEAFGFERDGRRKQITK